VANKYKSSEKVAKFEYFENGSKINENCIHEERNNRLHSGKLTVIQSIIFIFQCPV
jgi:hypothetical protein